MTCEKRVNQNSSGFGLRVCKNSGTLNISKPSKRGDKLNGADIAKTGDKIRNILLKRYFKIIREVPMLRRHKVGPTSTYIEKGIR